MKSSNKFDLVTLGRDAQAISETASSSLYSLAQTARTNWKGFPFIEKMSDESKAQFKDGVAQAFAATHPLFFFNLANKSSPRVVRVGLRVKEKTGSFKIDTLKAYQMGKSDLATLRASDEKDAVSVHMATSETRAYVQRHAWDVLNDLCAAGLSPDEQAKLAKKTANGRGASKGLQRRINDTFDSWDKSFRSDLKNGKAFCSQDEWKAAKAAFFDTLKLKAAVGGAVK
jgi:hypothetical protein